MSPDMMLAQKITLKMAHLQAPLGSTARDDEFLQLMYQRGGDLKLINSGADVHDARGSRYRFDTWRHVALYHPGRGRSPW